MNHQLTLLLDQTKAQRPGYRLSLLMRNDSPVRLLLAFPEISDLRFLNQRTGQNADWCTFLFVSAAGGGFVLEPGQDREFDFQVRPSYVDTPAEDDWSHYYRWSVGLSEEDYEVISYYHVGSDYFDPDSHWQLPDLESQAQKLQATVWQGETTSNRLPLIRSCPAPDRWPPDVVQLAEALAKGEDCAFALHDALEEAGYPELAAHFKQETWHTKGCWVLGLLLGMQ